MEFRLLGPLEVDARGQLLEIKGRRPRALLAVLLLHANRPVPVDRLIEALWGADPPSAARQSIQYFVHQLRRALSNGAHPRPAGKATALETHGSGYLLRVGIDELDTERFRRRVEVARAARSSGDLDRAWEEFGEALALWRGPALSDFAADTFAQPEIARLEELRLSAVEEQMKTGLALGRHGEIIGELEGLVRSEPLREQLRALLMIALYRSGRQGQALEVYRSARDTFVERLGIEPGAELQWLERAIMEQHHSLLPPERTWQEPGADARAGDLPSSAPGPPSRRPADLPSLAAVAVPDGGAAGLDGEVAPDGEPAPLDLDVPAGRPRERRREERKTVTVLVASISSSDSDADLEDVRARLQDALERVRQRVEHYGGYVQAFVLGRLLAVFGAPRSHEDDPERAVRAALEICAEAHDPATKQHARVGVATGEVVVSVTETVPAGSPEDPSEHHPGAPAAAGEPQSMTVAGDVVHAAAALEALATPNVVVVGTGTYRATRRVIDYRPLRRQAALLEQATGSVTWQAVAPRGRTGAESVGDQVSPLVERDRELSLMADLLHRFLRDEEPQFLTIVSEPGLGKTRLVAELATLADRNPQLVTWRRGRSTAYGEAAFWSLAQVVRAHAGVLESDSAGAAEAKLANAVGEVIRNEAEAADVTGHLRLLLGTAQVPGSADQLREAFGGWARFLGAVAHDRPLVLVFEDLQWADDTLLDFVHELPEQIGTVPLLVVGTGRLDLLERRPGWGGGKRNATTISLNPLSSTGTAELLAVLLDGTVLPAETHAAILDSSGGNPLYIEEYVRMLHDLPGSGNGDGSLPIPESVQQLIAARLDALPVEDKLLLQDAAVVGQVGWAGALMALGERSHEEVQAGLQRLERRDLLRRVRVASVVTETEYTFRHALVREVAYAQVMRAERAEKHRRVATWIEALNPERVDERIEHLAHHYHQALALARAGGTPDAQAIRRDREALARAGDRALSLGAYRTAERFYRQALDLDPDSDDAVLLLGLGRALAYSVHSATDVLLRARDRFDAAGDEDQAATAELVLAQSASVSEPLMAQEYMRRALSRKAISPSTRIAALAVWSFALFGAGHIAEAFERAQEALRLGARSKLAETEGTLLAHLVVGCVRSRRGDAGGVEEVQHAAKRLADGQFPSAASGPLFMVGLWYHTGDLGRAAVAMNDLRQHVATSHSAVLTHAADTFQTALDYASGRWSAVLRGARSAEGFRPDVPVAIIAPWRRAIRGAILLGQGDVVGALADTGAAVADCEAAGDRQILHIALGIHGRALLAAGRDVDAAACLDRMLATQRAAPADYPLTPDQAVLMVELERDVGELPAGLPLNAWSSAALAFAGHDFQDAAAAYGRIGSAVDAAVAQLYAAREHMVGGRVNRARTTITGAAAFFDSAGATAWFREAEGLRSRLRPQAAS